MRVQLGFELCSLYQEKIVNYLTKGHDKCIHCMGNLYKVSKSDFIMFRFILFHFLIGESRPVRWHAY